MPKKFSDSFDKELQSLLESGLSAEVKPKYPFVSQRLLYKLRRDLQCFGPVKAAPLSRQGRPSEAKEVRHYIYLLQALT